MVKLTKKLALLATMIIVSFNLIHLGIFHCMRSVFYTDHGYSWINKLPNSPKILLMGSSTTHYNLNANVINTYSPYKKGEVINLASPARTPLQSYYVYKTLENDLNDLEYLFYGLDNYIFSKHYYQHDNVAPADWNIKERLHFIKNGKYLDKALLGGNFNSVFERILINSFQNFFPTKTSKIPAHLGGGVLHRDPKDPDLPIRDLYEFDVFNWSSTQFKYLQKLKKAVESKGGRFVILLPPSTTTWQKNYETQCKDIDLSFRQQFDQYFKKLYISNFYRIFPEQYDDALFYDDVHLTYTGQRYYSMKFASHLKSLDSLSNTKLKPLYEY